MAHFTEDDWAAVDDFLAGHPEPVHRSGADDIPPPPPTDFSGMVAFWPELEGMGWTHEVVDNGDGTWTHYFRKDGEGWVQKEEARWPQKLGLGPEDLSPADDWKTQPGILDEGLVTRIVRRMWWWLKDLWPWWLGGATFLATWWLMARLWGVPWPG